MTEKELNPETMTRATEADIKAIWFQLWGGATVLYLMGQFEIESGEYLDLTQAEVMTLPCTLIKE